MSVNIDIMESDIGRQLKSGRVRHKWRSQGQMTNRWASFQKDLSFFLIYIIMLEFLTVFPGHLLHFCSGCLSSNSRCDLIALYYSAQAEVTKITQAEWRKTGIYASQSGGWKSKIKVLKCWQVWFLPRPLILACKWPQFAVSLYGLFSMCANCWHFSFFL